MAEQVGYSLNIGTNVLAVINQDLATNLNQLVAAYDGDGEPSFVGMLDGKPAINITTPDMKLALGSVAGMSGGNINLAATNTLVAAAYTLADGGSRTEGATHTTWTIEEGFMVPTRWRASADPNTIATVDYTIHVLSLLDTEPITTSIVAALADELTGGEVFILGPTYIDEVAFPKVTEVEGDPGLQVHLQTDSGRRWARNAFITAVLPSISLRGYFAEQLDDANLGLTGKKLTTSAVIWLRQLEERARPYADDEEKHIKMTMTNVNTHVATIGGTHPNPLLTEIILQPKKPASGISIAVAVDQAITAE